jgi:hypothetical protein
MEVRPVRAFKLVLMVALVSGLIWGCVEELDTGSNLKPMIWFTRGPDEGEVIFENAVNFEWVATDWDDDLGMGSTYIRLEPATVRWFDDKADSFVTFTHPEGWVRVYENIYGILDLPDSTFFFSTRVIDGRGADSVVTRRFYIRYDPEPPAIVDVDCPPYKPTSPVFCHTYVIDAYDVARSERAATPVDSLEYNYVFVPPSPLERVDSDPEWSVFNKTYEACVDGQTYPGVYKFRCKVRDRAGNATPVYVCEFKIEP